MLVWGVLVGAGSGMVALVLGATVVNRWFTARRGLAMGLLTASTATGQLVFLPLLAARDRAPRLAGGRLHHGRRRRSRRSRSWRSSSASAPPTSAFHPTAAAESSRAAVGGPNPARMALAALGDGARSRDFWLLTATFFICGASTNGLVGTHLIPAAHDHGIPEVRAASLLALMGVFDLVGTTGAGWLSDRWSSRHLLAWYYGLRGLSLFFLPFALGGPQSGLWVFAVWYGLDWIATVPPTLRLTTDAFGPERAPIIFGWIGSGHQIGAALTAFTAGWIRTYAGDYQLAFWGSGALCLLAAALALQVGSRSIRASGSPVAAVP